MTSDKAKCTGCGACIQLCSSKAINMMADGEGFVYPSINAFLCTECGKCSDSCPDNKEGRAVLTMAYRSTSLNILKESASGGAFSAIAEHFWKRNPDGIVFGAALILEKTKENQNTLKVRHISVTKREGIGALRGSKYVQSDWSVCLGQIEDMLNTGKSILFSGTPCQAAAVRKLYGYRENLLIVDIVCNGVGSPAVFDKYLNEVSFRFGSNPISVNFRNKKYDKGRGILINLEDGNGFECSHKRDRFCKMYMTNMISRMSCYQCDFTTPYRNSDITLGDFHGLDNIAPEFGENNTSLVIAHTDVGIEYAEYLKSIGETLEVEIEQCLQPRLKEPAKEPLLRKIFAKNYVNMDYEAFDEKFGVMLKRIEESQGGGLIK